MTENARHCTARRSVLRFQFANQSPWALVLSKSNQQLPFHRMTSFRTVLKVPPSDVSISHQNRLLAIGSCFTEHIGARLKSLQFDIQLNPFGILYNPHSIGYALERLHSGALYRNEDLFFHNDLWHSFDHHGRFNHPDSTQALEGINRALAQGGATLQNTDRILLTLGTATVHILRENGRIVANCHKVPGQYFVRRRMEVMEIADCISRACEALAQDKPELRVILTVSPVRHLRDGFEENQRSKAALLLAVEELLRRHAYMRYFPAYEIVMDDLRDYRFYDTDMTHPSAIAIDYIWDQFAGAFFQEDTRILVAAIQKINAALAHRPFHTNTSAHQAFLENLCADMAALQARYPFLEWSDKARG